MKLINKNYFLFCILGLIVLYFLTRLTNILTLPIFTDEAIYIRWAQIATVDPDQRFISLTDGKQPSFIWLAAVFMRVINDPLLAGRLVSVFAGFGSMIGLYFLASEIFSNRKVGFLASLIYAIFPFALVYDRLALYDSLVAFFIIWSLYFEVLLVRRMRLDLAMILGFVIGGGMLTKTSANFALYLLPASVLLLKFDRKTWKIYLKRMIVYGVVSAFIAYAIYSILRLSPYFYIIGQKNITFIYSFSEWIRSPFAFLYGNFKGLSIWLVSYLTIPFLLLSFSAFVVNKKYIREKLLLFIWFIVPFMALSFFGKVIYPRFIFFMTMPLLVLGAYSLDQIVSRIKSKTLKLLLVLAFIMSFVVNDYLILTNFEKSFIPQSDKDQLYSSWPSGVGVDQTVAYLKEVSKSEKIYVGTEGTFGLMPYSLEIYLKDNPNVEIEGFWPINDNVPEKVLRIAKTKPTYFVFYQPCPPCPSTGIAPISWQLKQIFQIKKAEKNSYYTLYQILPQ